LIVAHKLPSVPRTPLVADEKAFPREFFIQGDRAMSAPERQNRRRQNKSLDHIACFIYGLLHII
jgi:hypothetical protein